MSRLGDRRAHQRLEVVGTFWASLEWSQFARVINISTTGLLVESPIPVAPESRQSVSLVRGGEAIVVDAHVCRFEQQLRENSPPAYLIGLEFISPPPELVHWVEQLSSGPGPVV